MQITIAILLVLAGILVKADNYKVTVGEGGLVYSPNSVEGDAGDTVEFVVTGVVPLRPAII